jgi:hypothetical protein
VLFCELEPMPTTRADAVPPMMDTATAQAIKDRAYEEYCSYIRDAWKRVSDFAV